jgi:hypothetical protein
MIAVFVSDLVMLNLEASMPEEILTVADSDTRIAAAVAEVKMFSATEISEEDVNVGAVVSRFEKVRTNEPLVLFVYLE